MSLTNNSKLKFYNFGGVQQALLNKNFSPNNFIYSRYIDYNFFIENKFEKYNDI